MGKTLEAELPPCDKELWRKGEHIATIIDIKPEEIERIVKTAAKESRQKIDWHYVGGRAAVRVMGDLEKARYHLRLKLDEYEQEHPGHQIYRFTTENDSGIPWPLT